MKEAISLLWNNEMSFNHLPHKVIVGPEFNMIPFQDWINENLKVELYEDYDVESIWIGNHMDPKHEFMFRRELDAMAFKLAWS